MSYFDQQGGYYSQSIWTHFVFLLLLLLLLVSQSVLCGQLLPSVTTADRQNRKPIFSFKKKCPYFNNYFPSFCFLMVQKKSFLWKTIIMTVIPQDMMPMYSLHKPSQTDQGHNTQFRARARSRNSIRKSIPSLSLVIARCCWLIKEFWIPMVKLRN